MKIRRSQVVIGSLIVLGIIFLVIGVMLQSEPVKYFAHSLRSYQDADAVAGYPIKKGEGEESYFVTAVFEPNLSVMSSLERYRLPIARSFLELPEDEVVAVGTGLVLYAGERGQEGEKVVLLGHRLPSGEIVQSFYGGLEKVKASVGSHVARGTVLGEGELAFEWREGVSLDIEQEEVAGVFLNAGGASVGKISQGDFIKKYGLVMDGKDEVDPLALIQEDLDRELRSGWRFQ